MVTIAPPDTRDTYEPSESDRERLAELVRKANGVWMSWSAVRTKDQTIESVRYNTHNLGIPESMASRTMEVRSGKGPEKVRRAKNLLINRDGPNVSVAQMGAGPRKESDRERVETWCQGALRAVEHMTGTPLSEVVTEDVLVKSRGFVMVLPNAHVAWNTIVTDDKAKDYDERCARFPIYARPVAARNLIPLFHDRDGLVETFEYIDMSVQDVIDTFQNENGEPLARYLANCVLKDGGYYGITPQHRVCVVYHCTKDNLSIFTTSMSMSSHSTEEWASRYDSGIDELLSEGDHGMGRVPYAFFPGSLTPAADPVLKYEGFLDYAHSLIFNLDMAKTQLASSARQAAWPNMVIQRPADFIGTGDRPADFVLNEGGVETLEPGEELKNPGWVNAENYRLLEATIRDLELQIDFHTLGAASYGSTDVQSGYLQAQLSAATENVLQPYEIGLSAGYSDLCDLLIRAARYILTVKKERVGKDGSIYSWAEIPVRSADPFSGKFVEMDLRLADADWSITASVKAKPVGGEAAQVAVLGQLQDRGLLDDVGFLLEMGKRNPQAILRRVERDKTRKAPQLQELKMQAVTARWFAALQQQAEAGMPQNPQIPSALAQVLRSQQAQARLPDPMDQQGTTGVGQAALPNLAAQEPNPETPTMNDAQITQRITHRQGGGVPGMAQTLPGGLNRMSETLGRAT